MKTLGQTLANRDNNFDTVRLLLASSVIFYHSFVLAGVSNLQNPLDHFLLSHGASLGSLAVGCFFFLSGLFVTQSFHRDDSPVHFLIKRFCRIWPGLFGCVTVTAVISCLLSQGLNGLSYLSFSGFYDYIVRNAILTPTWHIPGVFDGHANPAINGAIHTIPSEVKLYGLLLVLNGLLPVKSKHNIAIGAFAFLLLSYFLFEPIQTLLRMPSDSLPYFLLFFSGAIAYAAADYIKPYPWLGAIGLVLTFVLPAPGNTPLIFLTTCWIAVFIGQIPRRWRPRIDLSYGIYIYGWPCQQFVTAFFPHIDPYSHAVGSILLATAFARVSWSLVERPALDFGHGLTRSLVPPGQIFKRIGGTPIIAMAATACLFSLCVVGRWATDRFSFGDVSAIDIRIVDFGPKETVKGQDFGVQPVGASAMWLKLDHDPPKNARIVFSGQKLDTFTAPQTLTALVPKDLYAQAGEKPVFIEVRQPGLVARSASVIFRVTD